MSYFFRTYIHLLFIAWITLALVACDSKPNFKNVDITGSKAFGSNFSLLDVDGKHARWPILRIRL